jgi:hypothetical protein
MEAPVLQEVFLGGGGEDAQRGISVLVGESQSIAGEAMAV